MDEVSGDELWWHLHHSRPGDDESPRNHRTYTDAQLQAMMRDANDVLRSRIRRLQHELEAPAVLNDVLAMDAIESQILEAQNLMYSIQFLHGPRTYLKDYNSCLPGRTLCNELGQGSLY